MTDPADVAQSGTGNAARGASARERALRFNRGLIGLALTALLVLLLLPI